MTNALQLGPLLLPFTLLLVFACGASTLALGKWWSRSSAEVDRSLWYSFAVGFVVARVAFVSEYAALYLAAPFGILDIRDGGWNSAAGLVGAWLFVVYRARQAPATGRPLGWAVAAGSALFIVGSIALLASGGKGQQLPPLAFTALDGRAVQLADFKGKPLVVNLWATWCPPCEREMPAFEKAQARHRDVNFVFLNQGEDPQTVLNWLQHRGLTLNHVLIDPKRQASASFQQKGYPSTLFFNAAGELVSTRVGEVSAATLEEKIRSLSP